MVGTHADSLIAEAVVKGFGLEPTGPSFNTTLASEAVYKDATVPPTHDWTVSCVFSHYDVTSSDHRLFALREQLL